MDELWWDAKSLGMKVYKTESGDKVKVEDLCWVLNPSILCKKVTDRDWLEYLSDKSKNVSLDQSFERKYVLASYFVSQLRLFASMVTGRSPNCIMWLEQSFSYTMLLSMAYNDKLPEEVRSAALDFLRLLYLDRYPQVCTLIL